MSFFKLLAVILMLGLCLPAFAAEDHAPTDTVHAVAGEATHGQHEEGVGATLVEILSHHLVDSHEFDFFGLTVHLPTVQIGELRFLTKHQVWWVIASLLVFFVVRTAARQKSAVPTGLRNALEILVVFIRDEVLKPNLHGKTDAFLPYFLTLFSCILFANLLGLLPWGTSATGNVNVTAGLAICTLLLMIAMGIKENGVGGFLHSFAPPGVPGWLMPLIIIIEIVSFMIRPFALTIRLFANMLAGHAVIAVLLGLIGLIVAIWVAPIPIAVSVGVMLLEIVVALIQAYIFTMLTAVFVGLTMHPVH